MRSIVLSELSSVEIAALSKRPAIDFSATMEKVKAILEEVENSGDAALHRFTEQFDQVKLQSIRCSQRDIDMAVANIDEKLQQAMTTAAANIRKFHQQQLQPESPVETMPGVTCFRQNRAIEKVGIYVPGGTAILPSTVLMLAIPASLAGCREIILCSPPDLSGKIAPEILTAASIAGVTQVYCVGGAQAIAAMAYGTETIPRVDKIFGPGNQYVTAAKMLVSSQTTAIDMPAGPSEVLVIADAAANPNYIAADLLSQAEHGSDSQVVFVTDDKDMMALVRGAIEEQLKKLPRSEIAKQALDNSLAIYVGNLDEAFEFSNLYAPEHLIVQVQEPQKYLDKIHNAGSVFLGEFSPESVGDYASGTNHVLPTYGYARSYSGVSVDSFVKKITFQQLTREGLQNIGPCVETLAEAEGLMAHKNAVSIRLGDIS